ncbi:MAG: hypothetical protein O2845_03165 [Proteobacteria bacterium]|nr:hypothetical protein [Pseudomonadota bacterium]
MKKLIPFLFCSIALPVAAGWDEYWRSPDNGVVYHFDASQLARDASCSSLSHPGMLQYFVTADCLPVEGKAEPLYKRLTISRYLNPVSRPIRR